MPTAEPIEELRQRRDAPLDHPYAPPFVPGNAEINSRVRSFNTP